MASLLSCLLCVDTTLVHPLSQEPFFCLNGSKVRVKWLNEEKTHSSENAQEQGLKMSKTAENVQTIPQIIQHFCVMMKIYIEKHSNERFFVSPSKMIQFEKKRCKQAQCVMSFTNYIHTEARSAIIHNCDSCFKQQPQLHQTLSRILNHLLFLCRIFYLQGERLSWPLLI